MSRRQYFFLLLFAGLMLSAPWVWGGGAGAVDGVVVSSVVVTMVAVAFSLMSWMAFCIASRTLVMAGIPMAIITGACLSAPFLHALGPVGGMALGAVAGFAAFQFHMAALDRSNNRPLVVAGAAIALAYLAMATVVLMAPASPHAWDAGDGVGAWTGTVHDAERQAATWYDTRGFAPFLAATATLGMTVLIMRRMR